MSVIDERKAALAGPLRQATLVFLVKDGSLLLAMKKRGFGAGRYNGVGGKVEAGESFQQAALRECQEEIGVVPCGLRMVADLHFYFPLLPVEKGFDQQVAVYFAEAWTGEPVESEEMKPEWFTYDAIPYGTMWPDDALWLPLVLEGKSIAAEFAFGEDDTVAEWRLV